MKYLRYIVYVAWLSGVVACEKSSDGDYGDPRQEAFRDYIYALTRQWYLWSDRTTEVNLYNYNQGEELFEAMLYRETDRWSFIETNTAHTDLTETNSFQGFGVRLSFDQNQKLRVANVYRNSPMGQLGVERGWRVLAIDGKLPVSFAHFRRHNPLNTPGFHTFDFLTLQGEKLSFALHPGTVHLSGIGVWKILQIDGRNIGYLVLNSFDKDDQPDLERIFSSFAANNVKHLVIDLRYNTGGDIDLVQAIAAQILGPEHTGKLLYQKQHNPYQQQANKHIYIPASKTHLGLRELTVITGSATGSASELFINALKPYLSLRLIGQQTAGKPYGMYVWNYGNSVVGLVAFRLYNSQGESNYHRGFTPDAWVFDDLNHSLGDVREACLAEALFYIGYGHLRHTTRQSLPTYDRELYQGLRGKKGAY